uniref:Uncharacterized protein n=1 Tax=Chromera velia CCMP2878 TaxID=1169474 RepID=A0A0G4HBH9_9ALVE|eukprot:Cvel_6230.t1-p1 / transcript=Cvel_6230.t1 / gene=Cvel_6230 / organism=Chromera_velia_CCMP2878 / gene_product=hypothetical protein / transcript_product=hypothetical protein / location=Cvel_scaffold301:68285-73455(-) / protein_length=375 / sequence_SO=supercontig / SO=protein_coding / is_pseudo=false
MSGSTSPPLRTIDLAILKKNISKPNGGTPSSSSKTKGAPLKKKGSGGSAGSSSLVLPEGATSQASPSGFEDTTLVTSPERRSSFRIDDKPTLHRMRTAGLPGGYCEVDDIRAWKRIVDLDGYCRSMGKHGPYIEALRTVDMEEFRGDPERRGVRTSEWSSVPLTGRYYDYESQGTLGRRTVAQSFSPTKRKGFCTGTYSMSSKMTDPLNTIRELGALSQSTKTPKRCITGDPSGQYQKVNDRTYRLPSELATGINARTREMWRQREKKQREANPPFVPKKRAGVLSHESHETTNLLATRYMAEEFRPKASAALTFRSFVPPEGIQKSTHDSRNAPKFKAACEQIKINHATTGADNKILKHRGMQSDPVFYTKMGV